MGQKLVIAEKPSVASTIAKVLGAEEKKQRGGDGFKLSGDFYVGTYKGQDYAIGSAVGHLLELGAPEEFEVKRGKWSFNNLPVIPPYFDLKPIKKREDKLNALVKKIRSRTVTGLINACDAGREGELIFKQIIKHSGVKKPIERFWSTTMTPMGVLSAFNNLKPDADYKGLELSAECRAEADWLVGINGTRALTAFNSQEGGFFLTTVGRVQTPTLAIIVNLEERIRNFVPEPYWEVHANFIAKSGTYSAVCQISKECVEANVRDQKKIFNEEFANKIVAACLDKEGTVTETRKRSREYSPKLFKLADLQKQAAKRFGYSAKHTLDIAQRLYEHHKVITYPRTGSDHLEKIMCQDIKDVYLSALVASPKFGNFASTILKNDWVTVTDDKIFADSVEDHHAIIPTEVIPKPGSLKEDEEKIYNLIAARFLSVFYPPAQYDETKRYTVVEGYKFYSFGKVLVSKGWKEVAESIRITTVTNNKTNEDAKLLVPIEQGETVKVQSVEKKDLWTKPPSRLDEGSIISAMENAVDIDSIKDIEVADTMKQKGLGTDATRPRIIEGLVEQKYIRREKGQFIPTAKAFQLMQLLRGLNLQNLMDPQTTAEWEGQLADIRHEPEIADGFMGGIRKMVTDFVDLAKSQQGVNVEIENPVEFKNPCPACGGKIVENYKRFACTTPGCYFSLPKHPAGRPFEPEEVEELLKNHKVGPLSDFISRRGFKFESELVLEIDPETNQWGLKFAFEEKEEVDPELISGATAVASCPSCGGRILEVGDAYICENNVIGRKCSVRVSKTILQHELSLIQAVDLFTKGQTEFFDDFISNRTKKPFKAQLVFDAKKGIGFNFAPKVSEQAQEKVENKTQTKKRVSVSMRGKNKSK